MSWNILDRGLRHLTRTKQEPDRLLIQTIVEDRDVLENNQRHRLNGTIQTGDPAPFHPDGAETIYHFQIEPIAWAHFKKTNPNVYAALIGTDQVPRERAAAFLARRHPEWVVCSPKIVPLRGPPHGQEARQASAS
jgi:hypothetical protein